MSTASDSKKTGAKTAITPKEASLSDFIEANSKLLSALGIFTALTVFAGNLPVKFFGYLLTYIFLSLTLLLWIELATKYPPDNGIGLLFWFKNGLTIAILVVAVYWFLEISYVIPYAITFLGAQLALMLLLAFSKGYSKPKRFFLSLAAKGEWAAALFFIITYGVFLAAFYAITPPIFTLVVTAHQEFETFQPKPLFVVTPTPSPSIKP